MENLSTITEGLMKLFEQNEPHIEILFNMN